ncbi:MAG: PHP domain-containing protein [Candidatus Bipolaricaulota bacterium]|nr:PHP domain-containing protein [Candidatus Bipolaricaulota bacterium]
MPSARWADLHLHTRWSDGTLDLAGVVERARATGLAAIAITDHDTIGPELRAPVAVVNGVEVICGVEVKAEVAGERGEILGYFLAPGHPALEELFGWMAAERRRRMEAMVARCREVLGVEIELGEVAASAAGTVGRPHLAAYLVRRGLAQSFEDAFSRFLARGAPCYVPLPRPPSRAVIAAIRAAGGVAALAHPCFLPIPDWEEVLTALVGEGLAAVEVVYPYETSRQPRHADPGEIARLVEKLDLVPTGGSDDHGPGSVKDALGAARVPYAVVERLRALAPSVR